MTETPAEKLSRLAAEARERLKAAGKLPRDLNTDSMPKPVTETVPAQHWTEKDEETP